MDLFSAIVAATDQHPHIRTAMLPAHAPSRNVVSAWAKGFPDRDGKFVKEFQTTFNSSFWEIYLYAVFCEYGFSFDWTHAAPDFSLEHKGQGFCVEAVTANAAVGKPKEWERPLDLESYVPTDLDALNREAMVRLANAINGKHRKYLASYSNKPHVSGKPFVIAVAPFEQPAFNLQYDRPIKAVLYDHYVDEAAYQKDREAYPKGPPIRQLGFVTKENGADIELGLFTDDRLSHISAVLFSCTATWGKVDAMSQQTEDRQTLVSSVWGSKPDGRPEIRRGRPDEIGERIEDGLQIYHNPFAKHPLNLELFRRQGVVQNYFEAGTRRWTVEGLIGSLFCRSVLTMLVEDD
ncbi:hypothetical protein [Achromobacter piechaudii]|nr:hypothetical protein [Achromobacter piechaudii]